ncbi:hypothetical protein G6011_05214 [Alternaria panax]|uniref:Mid2 domain-containing protein n=1 Tax=Alternaria panax TaxID=48097 RepID=A0AAD4FCC2_9PLEO|nr:hypothetical protein G6011_05214 [Alternaria panax]
MAYAAAFSIPEPTRYTPTTDGWSPAPTAAPQLLLDLSRRQQGNNTCGFVSGSGIPVSAVTCPIPTDECATNTDFAIHGCCAQGLGASCTIATACIASTAMSASCTNDGCSSDAAIAKCTASSAPACYQWEFIYDRMVFTQYGCAASAFTSTAYHSLGMSLSMSSAAKETVTVTKEPDSTPTPSDSSSSSSSPSSSSKPSLGAIVGGTIGACSFVSFVLFVVFLAWRRRKTVVRNSPHSADAFHRTSHQAMVEYNPMGLPSPAGPYGDDSKIWQQQLPRMGRGRGQIEIAEVDGTSRAMEAPAAEK